MEKRAIEAAVWEAFYEYLDKTGWQGLGAEDAVESFVRFVGPMPGERHEGATSLEILEGELRAMRADEVVAIVRKASSALQSEWGLDGWCNWASLGVAADAAFDAHSRFRDLDWFRHGEGGAVEGITDARMRARIAGAAAGIAKALADPEEIRMRNLLKGKGERLELALAAMREKVLDADPADMKTFMQRRAYASMLLHRCYDLEDLAEIDARLTVPDAPPHGRTDRRWIKAEAFEALMLDRSPLELIELVAKKGYDPRDDWFRISSKGAVSSLSEGELFVRLRERIARRLASEGACSPSDLDWLPSDLRRAVSTWHF